MATVESLKGDLVAAGSKAPRRKADETFRDAIDAQRDEIARALPSALDPDRFARVLLTEVRLTPKLLQCSVPSVLGGAMLAAQLGLEIGGALGFCFLIPRKSKRTGNLEASFQLGYKGVLELARRSGGVASIAAHTVHEGDEFDLEFGSREHVHHRPLVTGDRGPIIGAFCQAWLRPDGQHILWMRREEIDHIRDNYGAETGPWKTEYAAMARKTVVNASAPYLPLTTEARGAIAHDGQVLTDLSARMVETPLEPPPDTEETDTANDDQPVKAS